MSEAFAVVAEGLENIAQLTADMKADVEMSAVQSINKTAERMRAAAAAEIRRQVNFPADYVAPRAGRLAVTMKATRGKLEARITARGRVTSLARFVLNSPGRGQAVELAVVPGRTVTLKRAFLMRLRAGTADLDTRSNQGLAVRLKPNDVLRNKLRTVQMSNGLYLLYGPSVAQVFINNAGGGVAEQLSPQALAFMESEFLRLLALQNG